MEIGEMIVASAKKTVWGWKGLLRVHTPEETWIDDGVQVKRPERRYGKLCSTTRITREDALADAERRRADYVAINQLP